MKPIKVFMILVHAPTAFATSAPAITRAAGDPIVVGGGYALTGDESSLNAPAA